MALPKVFAYFYGKISFAHAVVESADLQLIAPLLIALDPLVLVRMIEAFDGGMALWTQQAVRAEIPSHSRYKSLAVLWIVLEEVRRTAEVTHVMGVDASLTIV